MQHHQMQQQPMRQPNQISFPAGGGGMPQGMPQRMAPQGMAPQGMAPQGMAQQGMPQGMVPQQGMAQQGMPQGMPPQGMAQGMQQRMPQNMPGMPQQNMPQGGMGMPQQFMAQGMPPQGGQSMPQGMSANQPNGFAANNWPQQPKGVYEGAPGGMNVPPTAGGFRQQQDFGQNQVAAQNFPPQQNATGMGVPGATRSIPPVNAGNPIYDGAPSPDNGSIPTNSQAAGNPETSQDPKLTEVTQAESRKDHTAAVAILRDLIAADLENASIHHRLAVNLMAAGRISEAVTEFRIASALKPGTKTYAEDLARALAVHKRSMMSHHDGTSSNSEDAKGGSK